jgi:glutamate/aspartate transport system substrate-binding protein
MWDRGVVHCWTVKNHDVRKVTDRAGAARCQRIARTACVLVAATLVVPATLSAAPESPTLRKIREAGVISLGYRDASVPFSYLDEAQRPIGYSMDLCRHIVQAVKNRLGLRELELRFVPVSSATRVSLVANGQVDLECGVTTNNVERQRKVAFTITTYVAASRLVSRRAAPIVKLDDLRQKVVASTVGTTSLHHLQNLSTGRGLDLQILAARDDP